MKKRLGFLFVFALVACWFSVGAAWSDESATSGFRIQDFGWVDDKDLALYLNTQNSLYYDLDENATPYPGNIYFDHSQHTNINVNVNPAFYFKNITWHKTLVLNLPASISGYYHEDAYPNDHKNIWKSSSVSIRPYLNEARYFDDFFVGATLNPTGGCSKDSDEFISKSIQSSGFLQFGAGRVRNGGPADEAIQIIEELQQEHFLLKPVANTDMESLSELIAEERNRFALDSRKQNMEAIEKIVAFLAEKKYLPMENVKSILLIDDVYRYSRLNGRLFGSTSYLSLGGTYNTSDHYGSLNVSDNSGFHQYPGGSYGEDVTYHFELAMGGEYHLPVDRFWQFDLNGKISCLFNRHSIHRDKYQYPGSDYGFTRTIQSNPTLIPEATAKISFFPNLRSNFSLQETASTEHGYKQEESESWNLYLPGDTINRFGYRDWYFKNALEIYCTYFLSYSVTMGLSASWNYVYRYISNYADDTGMFAPALSNQSQKQNWWNFSFNVSYRIF